MLATVPARAGNDLHGVAKSPTSGRAGGGAAIFLGIYPDFFAGLSIGPGAVRRGGEGRGNFRARSSSLLFVRPQENPMRFMIIVKATPESERGEMPTAPLMAAMARYHEELAQAGVLLDASGLQRTALGWRVRYGAGGRSVIDGPFTETKELIAGYTLIQVRTREEALEWTRRFPNPRGEGLEAEIEVRQLFEMEDFAGVEGVEAFRDLEALRG